MDSGIIAFFQIHSYLEDASVHRVYHAFHYVQVDACLAAFPTIQETQATQAYQATRAFQAIQVLVQNIPHS